MIGTVINSDKDGSTVIDSHHPASLELNMNLKGKTIFSGTKGALNNEGADEPHTLNQEQEELLLNSNLDLGTLAAYAFMFNFHEAYSISHKLCVQLYDVAKCHKFVSDEVRKIVYEHQHL